jgi:hypothetical protein
VLKKCSGNPVKIMTLNGTKQTFSNRKFGYGALAGIKPMNSLSNFGFNHQTYQIYTQSSSKSGVFSKAKLHVWTWTRFSKKIRHGY